jgi:polar amino acid transport system substrate-binding protein
MFVSTKINLSHLPAFTMSKIYKNIAPVIFGLILSGLMPGVAKAETVMEKVARTGVLTAGTSKDALPFAYSDSQGKLTEYANFNPTAIRERIRQKNYT